MSIFKNFIEILTAREQRQGLIILTLMMVGMALEIVGIGLIVPVIALINKPNLVESYPALGPVLKSLGNPDQTSLIVGSMLTLIVLYLLKALFMMHMSWKLNNFSFGIYAALSYKLFTGYLYQPWRFHLNRNSAQLISNVMNEVNALLNNALQPGMTLLSEGMVLIGISFFLFMIQPVGTVIIAITVILIALLFHTVTRGYLLNWGKARQYNEGMRIQHLQQGLSGVKDIKLLGREEEFLAQYYKHNSISARVSQKQKTLLELPRFWLETLAVIGLGALVFVMIAQGKAMDTFAPTLGLFAAAAFRMMPSFSRIMASLQSIRYGLPAITTIRDELQLVKRKSPLKHSVILPFKHEIRLTNLSYQYEEAKTRAINNINIQIPRGASVGFIGESGAGKSTLVDIILGLLTPDKGKVLVDDIDIQSNMRSWQNLIGYVPQVIFLTDDTLRRNVAFGLSEEMIDDQAIWLAIKAAQLENFIKELPKGLDTIIGERGVRLSGGQRQRIGIARALYHDPEILVLDEATSSLDTSTEKEVMSAVNALQGNKTLLIVAHRLSTVKNCTFLYRIEQGSIIEKGSFEHVTNSYLSHGDKSNTIKLS